MNQTLIEFEKATGLGPTFAARLIGIHYVTYAQCRAGSRPLQAYHAQHVEALLMLSRASLTKLIEKYAYGQCK